MSDMIATFPAKVQVCMSDLQRVASGLMVLQYEVALYARALALDLACAVKLTVTPAAALRYARCTYL